MIPLLLWTFFVAAIYLILRPYLGQRLLVPMVLLAALAAGVAFSAERISFRAGLIDARENAVFFLIWGGLLAAIALTLHALIEQSWLSMWLAALGTVPLYLTQVAGYSLTVACLLLAAAVALRRGGSATTWLVSLLGGMLIWIVIDPFSLLEPRLVSGRPLLALLILALLAPLVPSNLARLLLPQTPRPI